MTISEAIASLTLCLENFGDVECKFVTSSEGNPAVELYDVDTELDARRFNARFPIKDIFIPGRN